MLFNFFVEFSCVKSFLKNKWLIVLLFISVFCIIYIFNKKSKCKKEIILNNKNNQYFELQGQSPSRHESPSRQYETNKNKLQIITKNDKNNEKNSEKSYHPIVIKISNIIIGRYNIRKLNDVYASKGQKQSKILIDIIYQNVNRILDLKQINNVTTDLYKFNEILDKITLIISRILFKITEDTITKILIGQYIIKKTNNNKEINDIYSYFIEVSKNTRLSVDERMNAIDILNLSNNKKYIEISKSLLQNIRNNTNINSNTTSIAFNKNLNRVVNNIKNRPTNTTNNINNVIHSNNTNQARLLVDRDGTTYPIPPDINVPPLPIQVEVKKPKQSIYDDNQNVHNSTINETTLKTATELVNKYYSENKSIDYIYYKTKLSNTVSPTQIEKVEKAIHRINTDSATFGKGFRLYTIYQSLLNLIEQHPQKNDLEERLLEELIDMSGKCSTGHLSRLINVLQGFETNLKVKVKINISDEIYAKIKHLIEKTIVNDENIDEIMEDMLSENKTIYIEFVKRVVDNKINEILKEYENLNINDISGYNNDNKYNNISDIVKDITIQSLDKYTGTKNNFNYLRGLVP